MAKKKADLTSLNTESATPDLAQATPNVALENQVQPRLRLEWIEAGSLQENPENWRKHPDEQAHTLRDVLRDPEIGWAGACLFNERTGRLIDGHLRKKTADPKEKIPVLVGNWSEDAERKILATLDPIAGMAQTDSQAFASLSDSIEADSLWVRHLLENIERQARNEPGDEPKVEKTKEESYLDEMDLTPFEKYDYIVLLFKSNLDFNRACEMLEIKKVKLDFPNGVTKVGLGRCVDGTRAVDKLMQIGRSNPAAEAGSLPDLSEEVPQI